MRRDPIINEAPGGPVVNLRKYGWVASPEENFSDDGAYFTAYRYYPDGYNPDEESNFRLTRTNYKGDTYISIGYENPVTGRTIYIDDLNGVPRQQAVEEFPKVMEKVKALYDKERSTEGPGGKALTDDEVSQVVETAVNIANYADVSPYKAYDKALQKLGFSRDDIPMSQERKMQNDVEAALRNAKAFDKDIIKKLASEYIRSVMEHMRSGFTSRGQYKKGHDLDTALRLASAIVENPTDKGSYIHISDLPDATQEKIKNWARNRIEKLYDFDDEE